MEDKESDQETVLIRKTDQGNNRASWRRVIFETTVKVTCGNENTAACLG